MGPNPVQGYLAELQKKGISPEDIQRQAAIIMRLFGERPEGVEIYYDRVFARPLSGNPARDGFNSSPSAFLIEAAKGLMPANALDAGMGQGRNAVYLAQMGWKVTGFDISKAGIAAARANAEKSGLRITTVKASYDAFDFGSEKWDLIVLTFAWAPVSDPEFVRRIHASELGGHFSSPFSCHRRGTPFSMQPESVLQRQSAQRAGRFSRCHQTAGRRPPRQKNRHPFPGSWKPGAGAGAPGNPRALG